MFFSSVLWLYFVATFTCIRCAVIGLERGCEWHAALPGLVEFHYRQLGALFHYSILGALKNKLLPGVPRYGSAEAADMYCQKGEQPCAEWEAYKWRGPAFGLHADFVQAGDRSTNEIRRTDLEAFVDLIRDGANMRTVVNAYPVQYIERHRVIEKYMRMIGRPRCEVPTVVVYWGTSGLGKSHRARREAGWRFLCVASSARPMF